MRIILKAALILLFLLFILFPPTNAQTVKIRGQVIDSDTRDALAFVTIQFNEGPEGCISDIDGRFTVQSSIPVSKLKLSYIGYKPIEYIIDKNDKDILVRLNKTAYELSEIVIKPGVNPANRIISQVIANRDLNNHEKLPSFTYTSYEKTIFGPESDSIPPIDSIEDIDTYLKVKEFFMKQYLFIMESVVKRGFKLPAENYNKVIASRVSGFSDPLFVFLMSQMQSTSFYTELINIVGMDYINPISKGSFKKYHFEIQDTIIEPYPYDTTYTISYRPLMNTNFEALKGTLAISTNGFAIRSVIARPASDQGPISVKIQQKYDFIDSTHWFPVQLNTDMVIKTKEIIIDSIHKRSIKIMGRGKSYISDINLNPNLSRNQFNVFEVDVQPNAYNQPAEVWNKYRIDSLTAREQETYRVIDSIGKAKKFDKRTNRLNALTGGSLSLGYVDLYLDNLFKVNRYEGFRLGLKLSTSDKVCSWMRVGGYVAYGFKDEKFKYGAEGLLIFDRFRNFYLKGGYYDDLDEAGADEKFMNERNLLNPERFREILVRKMDRTRIYKADISSRVLKYMTLGAGLSAYNKVPLYDYSYVVQSSENIAVTSSDFSFTEASLSIRYAYGEKFLRNERSTISLGTKYPIVQFFASHGFDNFLNGQYIYNRFDLQISKSFFTKYVGTTSFSVQAGLIDRDIPYVNLYNAKASFISFNLYSPGSFATMRMDEFIADRYASFFFSHNFGKLLFTSRHFNPEPELVTNIGFGALSHPKNHSKDGIKSYEKGYFESGLVINKIIRLGLVDVGFAGFYRYGSYALPTTKENLAWKVVFQFIL